MNFLLAWNNYRSSILHLSIMILLALYKYLATVYIVKIYYYCTLTKSTSIISGYEKAAKGNMQYKIKEFDVTP